MPFSTQKLSLKENVAEFGKVVTRFLMRHALHVEQGSINLTAAVI